MELFGFRLPEDFLIGTANSAFQSEGAWDRDGKSESVMEYYAREFAGKEVANQSAFVERSCYSEELPDRGCYFYDNYEAYIDDMQKTGQNTYRLALAWTRIIPTGFGEVNQKGIDYYNKVIDKFVSCGITLLVDLLHWDLPQCLMEKGGYENPDFPQWFEAYAKVCFEAFGDRVKMWSTFNENAIAVTNGYFYGSFPPFRKDTRGGLLAAHHTILAHFRAVRAYRATNQGGKIGAVNCITDTTPAEPCEEDIGAVARQQEFTFGWWVQPMLEGTYPQRVLRECPVIRENMPENYQQDLDAWFVPMDYIGLNYYISQRTEYNPDTLLLSNRVESFYSTPGQSYASYPAGLFDVVQYIGDRYHNIEMYITENGCAMPNINDEEIECEDDARITYIREHLRSCARLIRAGYNLKGYYYWNDADSYEELDGYKLRFGLTWVDSKTGRRRWKKSRYYFSKICKTRLIN